MLTKAICTRHMVKKYAVMVVASGRWERDISSFEAATEEIAEETKTMSLRQLALEEIGMLITSNSNPRDTSH